MSRSLIGAALAVALFTSGPAVAQARNACMDVPVQAGVEVLVQAGATNVSFLDGDAKDRAVDLYNSLPPEDDAKWSIVLLADLPDGGGFIAVGRAPVFCGRIMVPAEHWQTVKRGILGAAA